MKYYLFSFNVWVSECVCVCIYSTGKQLLKI